MKRDGLAWLLPMMMLGASPLPAQESERPASGPGFGGILAKVEGLARRVGSVLDKPLHPIVGGVGPGGGIGAGLEYSAPTAKPWVASGRALYTVRQYWRAEAVAGYHGRRAEVETFARGRDMSRLDFYGPGTDSDVDDRTNFRLREWVIGGHGRGRVLPWLAVGGRVEELWPDVDRGRGDSRPSIEQRFQEADAPGLGSQPRFGRYEASFDIHVPPGVGEALYQGTKYRMSYAIYSDRELDRFSFRRTEAEAQQRFALFGPHRRLTLSGWASTSNPDAGNAVPFYLHRTLGGDSDVRSLNEERIGSDGTHATLRGFRNLRFRDRHLVLLQAEYRVPVWGPVDASVFADAGKVTSRREDLDFSDLKRDFGFGLSLMRGPKTAVRVDVGFGGGEGTRMFFTVGDVLK